MIWLPHRMEPVSKAVLLYLQVQSRVGQRRHALQVQTEMFTQRAFELSMLML